MNILVRIRQVPDTTEVRIDPVVNTLIRDGIPSTVNPFDGYTSEVAARVKDANPDMKIVVVSMGPNQVTDALEEYFAIATDEAYLVSDRALEGSDTLAASYILSRIIRKIEETEGKFDAIFCGKQATDEDTTQVGPEIAEHLGPPQVTYVLEAEAEESTFRVLKKGSDHSIVIGITMPRLVIFTKPGFDPRYPSIKRKMVANRIVIPALTAADLSGIGLIRAGLKGSPTKVKESSCPERKKGGVVIKGDSDQASTAKLVQVSSVACLIQGGGDTADGCKDEGFMGID